MKIGYFTNQYPAVSHTFIRREILALEQLGVDITRYALKPILQGLSDAQDLSELERTSFILKAGVVEIATCVLKTALTRPGALARAVALAWKIGRGSERGLLIHLVYVVEAMLLAKWCRRDQIDHLHVHFGTNPAAIAMLAKQFSGTPYSMTVHGIEEFEKAIVLSLDVKLQHAAFAVCVSSYGRSQLMRWVPSELWDKIKLVRCGVDQSFLELVPTPVPDTRTLVCVGRLCVHKAQPLLIAALRKLHDDGLDCNLVLVGDGEMRPEVEAAIEKAQLRDHVQITGWASGEQVRQHMNAARVFVLPSISENLPVVIMEAMALGRPVVSTYVAGIPEIVQPGTTGWLAPASDVDALAGALKQALETPIDTLQDMGKRGKELVSAQHDAAIEAQKLQVLFTEYSPTTRRS